MQLLARWLGNPFVFVILAAAVVADVTYWRYTRVGHASLLGGASERNLGFKCPHCRLFVAYKPADEQDRVEPS